MKTKNDYHQLVQLIRTVIHNWDPYCLLKEGAPKDEFDHEIAQIAAGVNKIQSQKDAIEVVAKVFQDAFEPEKFSMEVCVNVGIELFNSLKSMGFIKQ